MGSVKWAWMNTERPKLRSMMSSENKLTRRWKIYEHFKRRLVFDPEHWIRVFSAQCDTGFALHLQTRVKRSSLCCGPWAGDLLRASAGPITATWPAWGTPMRTGRFSRSWTPAERIHPGSACSETHGNGPIRVPHHLETGVLVNPTDRLKTPQWWGKVDCGRTGLASHTFHSCVIMKVSLVRLRCLNERTSVRILIMMIRIHKSQEFKSQEHLLDAVFR